MACATLTPAQAPDSSAGTATKDGRPAAYRQDIPGTAVAFDMVGIPGGTFQMGAPVGERWRKDDEGPLRKVEIAPFWMGRCEVTWQEYEQWWLSLEKKRRKAEPTEADKAADAVTRPTPPYTDMSFGMGRDGYPAICMTQLAARTYCQWLSKKTGHFYRLPTEAEWEYACRAGTTTSFSFGEKATNLADYAWFEDNSPEGYAKVGKKKPNPWGLFDMHGNVAEWVLDRHDKKGYGPATDQLVSNPLRVATELYPRVVRGGSWMDRARFLRSASRMGSNPDWKMQDPQIPQSIWYHTDAMFVGFRVVRPVKEPTPEERARFE